jgi:hypothetical protein
MKMLIVGTIMLVLGMIVPLLGMTAPQYAAEVGGITITLHDDKCALPAVANLGRKAVWVEGSKTFEGCWGGHPQYPVLLFYFADKTVVIVPVEMFKKLTGA